MTAGHPSPKELESFLSLIVLGGLAAYWWWRGRSGELEARRNAVLVVMVLWFAAFATLAGGGGPAFWFELAGFGLLWWTAWLYKRRLAPAGPQPQAQARTKRQGRWERPGAGERAYPDQEQQETAPQPAKPPEEQRGSRAWALHELGVKEGATAGEVNARYRELMRNAHPDKGGDTSFAQDLNLARKVLLG